jgi:hypothetical protein
LILTAIHFFTELADFFQVLIEGGVVFGPSEPSHQGILLRQLDGQKFFRVHLHLEQSAKLFQGFLAGCRRGLEVGGAKKLGRELPIGFLADPDETR